jgi:hypothetical protein
MKTCSSLILLAASLAAAHATTYQFDFVGGFMSGLEEVPPNASPATGFEDGGGIGGNAFVYDDVTDTLSMGQLSYSGFLGISTAAHIHAAPFGVPGPVIFPLTLAPAGVTAGTVLPAAFLLSPAQEADLFGGRHYVNIHSTVFPGGEIRGQLMLAEVRSDVPEASTYGAIGIVGALALASWRRRAR